MTLLTLELCWKRDKRAGRVCNVAFPEKKGVVSCVGGGGALKGRHVYPIKGKAIDILCATE